MDEKQEKVRKLISAFLPVRRMYAESLHHMHLNYSELSALFFLAQAKSAMRMCDFAYKLRVTPPTVTQMLTKLENDALVRRINDSDDRRVVLVELTDAGQKRLQKIQTHITEKFMGLYEVLGDEDAEKLTMLLERVQDYFDKQHKMRGAK